MQHGEFIVDRWLVRAIDQICTTHSIELRRYSDNWVLELRKNDSVERIFGYKFSLNDSASANIAQDKVGAYQVMVASGLPAVAHVLLRTKAGQVNVASEWSEVVLKPLMGTSGHMVQAFDVIQDAMTYVDKSTVEAWSLSPRVPIARETRLVMLDDEVLMSYEKTHPNTSSGLAMFNLGQGAEPRNTIPDQEMIDLAVRASAALGLRLCAVDIVELENGERMVLEINDGVMMEYYSRFSDENKKIALGAYEAIILKMMGN